MVCGVKTVSVKASWRVLRAIGLERDSQAFKNAGRVGRCGFANCDASLQCRLGDESTRQPNGIVLAHPRSLRNKKPSLGGWVS